MKDKEKMWLFIVSLVVVVVMAVIFRGFKYEEVKYKLFLSHGEEIIRLQKDYRELAIEVEKLKMTAERNQALLTEVATLHRKLLDIFEEVPNEDD